MPRERTRLKIDFSNEVSRTKQSFKDECDINNILAKYQQTGLITHMKAGGDYLDLPKSMDYQESLEIMQEAEESFAGLPSQIRKAFDNDPQTFLNFVENPENIDKMREYGLAKPQEHPVDALQDSINKSTSNNTSESQPEVEEP